MMKRESQTVDRDDSQLVRVTDHAIGKQFQLEPPRRIGIPDSTGTSRGACTIRVPFGVGVEAQASGGPGDINASGLHHEGNRYFNDAVGHSPVTIHLDVESGAGDLKLVSG